MSWYNPASWSLSDAAKGFALGGPVGAVVNAASGGGAWNAVTGNPAQDDEIRRRQLLYQQAQQAGGFADTTQSNYNALGGRGNRALDLLQQQAMGQRSVSAEQLRQGLQQNLANQMSLAAGSSPQNAAMAARTAAIQSGRLGAGLAGQQAVAGLQERNQAQQAYGNLLQGLRGQDLQATLGSRQAAMTGYGAQNVGTPQKSWMQEYGPAIEDVAKYAIAASDRRLKVGIKEGDSAANKAIEGARSYTFAYKTPALGAGRQMGVMTDDLKRAGLGHAVVSSPRGDMVHAGKLAASNTAMIGALGRRLAKLESTSK